MNTEIYFPQKINNEVVLIDTYNVFSANFADDCVKKFLPCHSQSYARNPHTFPMRISSKK